MIDAGEHRDERQKPIKNEIAEVEARLHRRWLDTRVHASEVGNSLRDTLSSPYTLIGAAGVGFGVAWYYQQRDPVPRAKKPEPIRGSSGQDEGTSMLTTILNGLNLAGMVISMFPTDGQRAPAGSAKADPR
jgi:hypothetical protein